MEIKVTRMYTGSDGESHFEETAIPLPADEEGFFKRSEPMKATGIVFGELYNDKPHAWQNSPRRQLLITLSGEVEMKVTDGSSRIFRPGDILLAEDTTGRGHIRTRGKSGNHQAILIALE